MRTKTGTVIATKMQKTVIIKVDSFKTHPKYKKRVRASTKFYADNPENTVYKPGEKLTVYETRPLSKLKRWTVVAPAANAITK